MEVKIINKIHCYMDADNDIWLREKDLKHFKVKPIRPLQSHEYTWQVFNSELFISTTGFINMYCLNNKHQIGERLLKTIIRNEPPLNKFKKPCTYVDVMNYIDAYNAGAIYEVRKRSSPKKNIIFNIHWDIINLFL